MKLGTGFCSGVTTIIVFDCDSKNVGIITSLSALNKLNKLYMLFSVHYYEILGSGHIDDDIKRYITEFKNIKRIL